jgi:hypothetical protein
LVRQLRQLGKQMFGVRPASGVLRRLARVASDPASKTIMGAIRDVAD